MTVIISGLIFAWTLVVLLGLFTVFEERKRLDRLLQETGFNSEYPGAQKTEKNSLLELAKKLSMGQRLVNYLLQAGVPLRLEEALLIGGAVFLLLGYLIVAGLFIEALALTIVLMFLPSLWLASVRGKRIRKFDGQLGEAMVLMANSMRAGFSFFRRWI